jgi:hypothetical protein
LIVSRNGKKTFRESNIVAESKTWGSFPAPAGSISIGEAEALF